VEEALTPAQFRAVWSAKPSLRAVYRDYYRRMEGWCRPGVIVELGAGSGNLKETMPAVLATDIVAAPWLDAVVDGHALPFADRSVDSIVGLDVLHHVQYPVRVFVEAERVLRPGGRLVLVEPGITPVSSLVLRLGHPEPVDMRVDPLAEGDPDPEKHPMDSNQALPTLLAGRHRSRVADRVPHLRLVVRQYLSLFAYPLSGGFRPWSLMPSRLVGPVLRAEARLTPAVGRLLGFRLMLVYERVGEAEVEGHRGQAGLRTAAYRV
jgi:SAM-dependent methyltransferase